MTDTIKISRELAEQICVELEHDNDRYMLGRELRKALATPPADAADMGGQAGEEVLAVVTLGGLFHGGSGPELGDIDIEPDMRALERVQCELVNSSDDTHIELIDRRILAQHRQQAGKLVEALRIIHFRADCFVEDDMDMRVPSIEAIVMIAGEALAAWDVKP